MPINPSVLESIRNPTSGKLGQIGETLAKNRQLAVENQRADEDAKRRQQEHDFNMQDMGSKTVMAYAESMRKWDDEYKAQAAQTDYGFDPEGYEYKDAFSAHQKEMWDSLPEEVKAFVPESYQTREQLDKGFDMALNMQKQYHPEAFKGENKDFTLSAGQKRFDSAGEVIAEVSTKTDKPHNPFGNINPKDYTQESVGTFASSGNYDDLVAVQKTPLVVNQFGEKGEEEYWKKRLGEQAQEQGVIAKRAEASFNEMKALDRFLESSKNTTEGGAQPIISGVKNFLVSFGAEFEGLESVAEMEQAIGDIKVNFFKEFGARGLTDKDMEIIKDALPRINTSREARENVVRILKKTYAKNIEGYEHSLSEERRVFPDQSGKVFSKQWHSEYTKYAQEQNDLTPEESAELEARRSIIGKEQPMQTEGFGQVERTN